MDRDAWLQLRKTGVGGSDCAAALGLSKRKSALQLYLEKIGDVPDEIEDTAWLEWGRLLEPAIRRKYEMRHGCAVVVPQHMRLERFPFIVGTPDGLTDDRLVEIKTARTAQGFGAAGTDEVPEDYLLQTQHYLILTARPVADIAVLIGGSDYREYEIPADRELQQMIIEGESRFWSRVERRDPPPPQYDGPDLQGVLRRLFPGTDGSRKAATGALEDWRRVHDQATSKAAHYAAVAEGAKAHMLYEMGEASVLAFSDGKALRRKLTKRKGFTVEPSEYMDARFVNDKD